MKKIWVLIIVSIFSYIYAETETASIEPDRLPNNSYGHTIIINFYPISTSQTPWINGKIQINIPSEFPNPPSLIGTNNGYVEAIIMRNGITQEPINNSNILIEGYTITINGLTLLSQDYVKIIYGSKSAGGYGIGTPMQPGIYYFEILGNRIGENLSMIHIKPSILISNLVISKSASDSYVMAQDIFTYYISYSNISYMHPLYNVYIWDTIPEQFDVISVVPQPVVSNSNYYIWNIGTVMYMSANVITVVLYAKDGILKSGNTITNKVRASGNDMYNNIYNMDAINTVYVCGVNLNVNLEVVPYNPVLGQNITVLMSVTNDGNTLASYVVPDSFDFLGSGNVNLVQGPMPTTIDYLLPFQNGVFTWIYKTTKEGEIVFSSRAKYYEGGKMKLVYSNFVQSNSVIITSPNITPTLTNTKTPISTSTMMLYTPTLKETFTFTPTEIISETPTCTFTPTYTNTILIIPTATEIITPFVTKIINEDFYLDKNYFNPEKGDKVKINYKLDENGETVIRIYNLNGDLIKTLLKNYENAGLKTIEWNGRNEVGKIVGRGIYFIHIKQKNKFEIKKVFVIK